MRLNTLASCLSALLLLLWFNAPEYTCTLLRHAFPPFGRQFAYTLIKYNLTEALLLQAGCIHLLAMDMSNWPWIQPAHGWWIQPKLVDVSISRIWMQPPRVDASNGCNHLAWMHPCVQFFVYVDATNLPGCIHVALFSGCGCNQVHMVASMGSFNLSLDTTIHTWTQPFIIVSLHGCIQWEPNKAMDATIPTWMYPLATKQTAGCNHIQLRDLSSFSTPSCMISRMHYIHVQCTSEACVNSQRFYGVVVTHAYKMCSSHLSAPSWVRFPLEPYTSLQSFFDLIFFLDSSHPLNPPNHHGSPNNPKYPFLLDVYV